MDPLGNLTRLQYLIWLGHQQAMPAATYNEGRLFEINDQVDRERFMAAIRGFEKHFDGARTVFLRQNGQPHRETLQTARNSHSYVDLSREPDPLAAARRMARVLIEEPFDVADSILRSALYKLSDDRYAWASVGHHLMNDGVSAFLVLSAIDRLYHGQDLAPSVPYASILERIRSRSEVGRTAATRASWATRLERFARLRFPELAADGGTAGRRLRVTLGDTERNGLDRLVESTELSFWSRVQGFQVIYLMAMAVFLCRRFDTDRVVVGVPIPERMTREARDAYGLFLDIVPIPIHLDDDSTVVDAIRHVKQTLMEAIAQPYHGVDLDLYLNAYPALVNVLSASPSWGGRRVRYEELFPGRLDPAHSMRLQVFLDGADRVDPVVDVSSAAFPGRLGDQAVGSLVSVVRGIAGAAADPRIRVGDLSVLEKSEAAGPPSPLGPAQVQPTELLADAFERYGGRVAVRDGGQQASYDSLARRAEAIGALLDRYGLSPGENCLVAMQRSAAYLASLLACIQRGVVFVPTDVAYPAPRIRQVAEVTGARVVLSTRDDLAMADAVVIDPTDARAEGLLDWGSASSDLDGPAYILFTSGSTGVPKGVVVSRRSLGHYLDWALAEYAEQRSLNMPLFTSTAFDLTLTSTFLPLLSGGQVVAHSGDLHESLPAILSDPEMNLIKLTPAHVDLLPLYGTPTATIHTVIVGGEALLGRHCDTLRDVFGSDIRIINEYGPTEATVGCITFDASGHKVAGAVPIGKPAPDVIARVLDRTGREMMPGSDGELYVGGPGLACGYLDDEEETARKFGDFEIGSHRRLYRTGDLVRQDHNGDLTYLGRTDDEFKINGVRSHPSEIEKELGEHPEVAQCAVAIVSSRQDPATATRCRQCGMSSSYPEAQLDETGTCGFCRRFPSYAENARAYFKSEAQLHLALSSAPAGRYNVLSLLSGGKDSTYALAKLVDAGHRVLAFTLDNGYLSEEARANIGRVVRHLEVDHVFGTTPHMNEIFRDSLNRHANVCNGCFKTIYTLALREADRRNIPFIVTGLSRGQFFETRLTESVFQEASTDANLIDLQVLNARRNYHTREDAVLRLLDGGSVVARGLLDRIQILDFYRYCDDTHAEMLSYLDERLPWVRPSDTGRSTNCLINDAGIHVHKSRRGYHNYEFPYSWDVRIGHKTREEAVEELEDDLDERRIREILNEVGYDASAFNAAEPGRRLVAFFTSRHDVSPEELRSFLLDRLPRPHIPTGFVHLGALPVAPSGKVDRTALERLAHETRPETDGAHDEELTAIESAVATAWKQVLDVSAVSLSDDFFELGGDSLGAIRVVSLLSEQGIRLTPGMFFQAGTLADLSAMADVKSNPRASEEIDEPFPLTPVMAAAFADKRGLSRWAQVTVQSMVRALDADLLKTALQTIAAHHPMLRARFQSGDKGPEGRILDREAIDPDRLVALTEIDVADSLEQVREDVVSRLDVSEGPLMAAGVVTWDDADYLVWAGHHLVVDALSWDILYRDLEKVYLELEAGVSHRLPDTAISFAEWATTLTASGRHRVGPNGRTGAWEGLGEVSELIIETLDIDAAEMGGDRPSEAAARLLASLVLAVSQAKRLADVWVGLETHGRSQLATLDVSRTVGCFTLIEPTHFDMSPAPDANSMLRAVQAAMLTAQSGRGMARRGPSRREDLVFNYLGDASDRVSDGTIFQRSDNAAIHLTRSPDAEVRTPLEVTAQRDGAGARITLAFSPLVWTSEERARLFRSLRKTIAQIRNASIHDVTPSEETRTPAIPTRGASHADVERLKEILGR